MAALLVALVVTSVVALCIGRYSVDPSEAFGAVRSYLYKVIHQTGEKPTAMENVIFVLRVPRILGAIVIGAALSLSGAVYQSVFKNPLVSPDILGVSSGSSVGAATAILLGGFGGFLPGDPCGCMGRIRAGCSSVGCTGYLGCPFILFS